MKTIVKLPKVSYSLMISSEDDRMYVVMDDGKVIAHIVDTIDNTRQLVHFVDGTERYFEDTSVDEIMTALYGKRGYKFIKTERVVIFYNDVFVSEKPYEIYAGCPSVYVPIDKALEYAEAKIENRQWDAYCIPAFVTSHQIKYN